MLIKRFNAENTSIHSDDTLSLSESKILTYLIHKYFNTRKVNDFIIDVEDFTIPKVEVSYEELLEVLGISNASELESHEDFISHNKITLNSLSLAGIPNEFLQDSERSKEALFIKNILDNLSYFNVKIYTESTIVHTSPIYSISFSEDNIKVTLSPQFIKAYYCSTSFTCVPLKHLGMFNNYYTLRLYEYLLIHKSSKAFDRDNTSTKLNFDELKKILGVTSNNYNRYGDFKKRVLLPAIENMNELGYKVDFNEVKDGRKVLEVELKLENM